MLFEVEDLAVASPATVSRCGMVYNDWQDLGWKPFVWSWLNHKTKGDGAVCSYTHVIICFRYAFMLKARIFCHVHIYIYICAYVRTMSYYVASYHIIVQVCMH